ncbi:MAG: hypothetical protein RIQ99_1648, partial [Pseudomonadota bacterium]
KTVVYVVRDDVLQRIAETGTLGDY